MKLRFLNFSVIFFILCTFYSKKIAAQKNWQPITIIKVNGDTIHGEFLFKNKFKSFKSLSVRDEKSKAKLFYLPQVTPFVPVLYIVSRPDLAQHAYKSRAQNQSG